MEQALARAHSRFLMFAKEYAAGELRWYSGHLHEVGPLENMERAAKAHLDWLRLALQVVETRANAGPENKKAEHLWRLAKLAVIHAERDHYRVVHFIEKETMLGPEDE